MTFVNVKQVMSDYEERKYKVNRIINDNRLGGRIIFVYYIQNKCVMEVNAYV